MLFTFFVIVLLASDGILIYYLSNFEYFSPWTSQGDIDYANVVFLVFLAACAVGLLVSLISFWVEKFISCGRKEFPSAKRAITIGLVVMVVLFGAIMLHIFHFLNFFVGLILFVLLIVGIMLLS